eukprot:759026-Rhodomonas_salina.2
MHEDEKLCMRMRDAKSTQACGDPDMQAIPSNTTKTCNDKTKQNQKKRADVGFGQWCGLVAVRNLGVHGLIKSAVAEWKSWKGGDGLDTLLAAMRAHRSQMALQVPNPTS